MEFKSSVESKQGQYYNDTTRVRPNNYNAYVNESIALDKSSDDDSARAKEEVKRLNESSKTYPYFISAGEPDYETENLSFFSADKVL